MKTGKSIYTKNRIGPILSCSLWGSDGSPYIITAISRAFALISCSFILPLLVGIWFLVVSIIPRGGAFLGGTA